MPAKNARNPDGTGIRSVCLSQLRAAARCLRRRAPSEDAIHRARTHLKNAEAILRLLRLQMPDRAYRQIRQRIIHVRHRLGVVRDLAVNAQELVRIVRQAGLQEKGIAELCRDWYRQRQSRTVSITYPSMSRALRTVAQSLATVHLHRQKRVLRSGLRRLYRRAAKSCQRALESPTEHNLHECRRRTQHLRYGLELAAPGLSCGERRLRRRSKQLGDRLGQFRDLRRLDAALVAATIPGGHRKKLRSEMARLESAALAESLDMARQVYAKRRRRFRGVA